MIGSWSSRMRTQRRRRCGHVILKEETSCFERSEGQWGRGGRLAGSRLRQLFDHLLLLAVVADFLPECFPTTAADGTSKGEHRVDVVFGPAHPSPFHAPLDHHLMPAFNAAGTNGKAELSEVGIVHHLQATLDVEDGPLYLRCLFGAFSLG